MADEDLLVILRSPHNEVVTNEVPIPPPMLRRKLIIPETLLPFLEELRCNLPP